MARRGTLAAAVLLSMLGATPVLAQGHILFDLSHEERLFSDPFDETTPQGWKPAMDRLAAAGYTWSVIPEGGSITPEALFGSSFLIVAEPLTSFSSAEVAAVLDYVQAGGGLLVANDFNAPINDLSAPTDVLFLLGPSSGFATVTDIVQDHPVTEGIDQIDWPIGTPLLVGPSAVTLASYLGQPVLAAQEYGAGRIVYVGDNELFSNYGINNPENTPLLLNIAGWLAADTDGDGVGNADDLCPGTPAGATVDVKGCSYPQRQEAACPVAGDYNNHGHYVSCVAHAAHQGVKDALITHREACAAVVAAARSDVGKNDGKCDKGGKHDKCKKHGKDHCDKCDDHGKGGKDDKHGKHDKGKGGKKKGH